MTRLMMDESLRGLPAAVLLAAMLAGCATGTPSTAPTPAANPTATRTLKDAYGGRFLVGAALNEAQFTERDTRGAATVKGQFNTITPENVLKWEHVHPRLGEYDFALPDQFVGFGERNGMFIVGHTLLWHQQTPDWVTYDTVTLRATMVGLPGPGDFSLPVDVNIVVVFLSR